MPRLKILYLISSGGFFGAEKVVIMLCKKLSRISNIDIFLGIMSTKRNTHLGILNAATTTGLKFMIFDCNSKFSLKLLFDLREFIKKNDINIIHSQGYKSNFYAMLSTFGTNVRKVTTCHNWLKTNLKMKLYANLDKLFLKLFQKIIVVSSPLKEELLRSNISLNKIKIINNGIDCNEFSYFEPNINLKKSFNITANELIIGSIGRLSPEKGHSCLLKSFKKVHSIFTDTKLLIVGDGFLKQKLLLETVALNIKNDVIFTGNRSDIPELLNIIDIFVLSSLNEGMPIALLEAMAAKKSIIATKVGSIPSIIFTGFNGLLIEPGNTEELSKAIIELLNNRDKACLLAKNSYTSVRHEFSDIKMINEYIAVYNSLILKNGQN